MITKCNWCGKNVDGFASHKTWRCSNCRSVVYNPRFLSFAKTTITAQSTLAQICKLFDRFSAIIGSYGIINDTEEKRTGIDFILRAKIKEETIDEKFKTTTTWKDGGIHMRFVLPVSINDKGSAQALRLMLNWLENTLEAIAVGAIKAEDAFLSYVVGKFPDGREATLGDIARSQLVRDTLRLPMMQQSIPINQAALPEKAGE